MEAHSGRETAETANLNGCEAVESLGLVVGRPLAGYVIQRNLSLASLPMTRSEGLAVLPPLGSITARGIVPGDLLFECVLCALCVCVCVMCVHPNVCSIHALLPSSRELSTCLCTCRISFPISSRVASQLPMPTSPLSVNDL